MRTSGTRRELMKECKRRAFKEFDTELRIAKQIDHKYYGLINRAVQVKPQTRPQIANLALAIRSYRTLHCAADDLENGYYEVAMTLLRQVYENMLQMMYFAHYGEEAEKWLSEVKEISQKEIRRKLGMDGFHLQSVVRAFCAFAQGNFSKTLNL